MFSSLASPVQPNPSIGVSTKPSLALWEAKRHSSSTVTRSVYAGQFDDQLSGWRDYADNFFGRRRFDKPAEIREKGLYLKAPFPRFEALDSPQGMSLIMSTAETTDPILQQLELKDKAKPRGVTTATYNLFYLAFRLDYVTHGGEGEYEDYMNVNRPERVLSSKYELIYSESDEELQTIGDLGLRAGEHVLNTFTKQYDNIINSASTGSPGQFVKELAKGAAM